MAGALARRRLGAVGHRAQLRIPRTLLGLGVGAALGLAGALMQALTRNPLAEPGLLGVNLGASSAVVVGDRASSA